MLLVQAVAGPPPPRESTPSPSLVARPCPTADDGDDVVVCGRKSDPPRLVRLPEEKPRSAADMMTFRLPGHATGNVHGIQSELPGGAGQGAAVSIRIPFGKGKKD